MQPDGTLFIIDTCGLYWSPGIIIPNKGHSDCLPDESKGTLVVIPEIVIHELMHFGNNSEKHKATPYQRRMAKLLLQAIFKGFEDYTCSTDFTRTSNLGFRKRNFSLVKPARKFLNSMPTEVLKHDDVVLATALYCAMLKAGVSPVVYDRNFDFGSVDATLVTADKRLAKKARRKGLRVMPLQGSSNGSSKKGKKQKPKRRSANHRVCHHTSYNGDTLHTTNRWGYL